MDGSIQAFTALLTQPYWVPQANQYDDLSGYVYNTSRSCATESCGQNDFPYTAVLDAFFLAFHEANIDVVAHCNGDAMIDNFIQAVNYTRNNQHNTASQTRFIVLHSQTARQDQFTTYATLGINPSFFSPQIFYWGDLHYEIYLGPTRANYMNNAQMAVQKNITYTLHNDSPVVQMRILNGRNTFI